MFLENHISVRPISYKSTNWYLHSKLIFQFYIESSSLNDIGTMCTITNRLVYAVPTTLRLSHAAQLRSNHINR